MATKTTKAAQDAAGRRVKTKGEPPLASYVDKNITPVMADYTAWIKEQTGYDVDERTVQLAGILRSAFQKSETNQARIAAAKERNAEEVARRAQAKIDRAAAKAEREAERARKAAEPKPEKVAKEKPAAKEKAAKPAPKAKATSKPAAKPAAKPAPAGNRRRAAKPAANSDF